MPKKSTTDFTFYTFRYDYEKNDTVNRDKLIKFIPTFFPKYAIFDEVSDVVEKTHIQGKIGKSMSLVQIRKKLKENFPFLHKSNYSLVDIKTEGYDGYICKDGKPLINNVFTDEYIKEQVEIHKVNRENFEKKQAKKKSTTFTQDIAEEFYKEFQEECNHIVSEFQPDTINWFVDQTKLYHAKQKLLMYIIQRLGKAVKVFDSNILQRMYNGVKNNIITRSEYDVKSYCNYISNSIQL